MTKQEIYSTLVDDGEKLPPISKITKAELEARFRELYGTSPDGDAETPETPEEPQEDAAPAQEDGEADNDAQNAPETPAQAEQEEPAEPETRAGQPPMLHFTAAGWCDALRRSYFIGWYEPQTWEEYDALLPFAEG